MAASVGLTSSSQLEFTNTDTPENELLSRFPKSIVYQLFEENVNMQDPSSRDLKPDALISISTLSLDIRNSPTLLALRGEVYRLKKVWREAFSDFNAAIKKQPKWAYPIGRRGAVLFEVSQYERAFKDLNRAYKLDPNDPFVLSYLGEHYCKEQDFSTSKSYCTAALNIDPNNIRALSCRSECYARTGIFQLAEADGKKALKADPENPVLFLQLGLIYHDFQEWQPALSHLNNALYIQPDTILALITRAQVQFNLDDIEATISDFERALKIANANLTKNPTRAFCWEQRALIYYYLDLQSHFESDTKKALELNPNFDVNSLIENLAPLVASDSKHYPRFHAYCESVRQKIEETERASLV